MQTVEAKVRNNQQSKIKKMLAKRMAEVWQQLLAEDGNMVVAMVTATRQQQWRRQWLRLLWRPRQRRRAMAEMRSTGLLMTAAMAEARATVGMMAAVRAAALGMTAMRAMAAATAEARATAAKIAAVR